MKTAINIISPIKATLVANIENCTFFENFGRLKFSYF